MKVLLSAYSCEPGLGSEAAVGWGWATTLACRHEVCVLTRDSNRRRIEDQAAGAMPCDLRFLYYDLPGLFRAAKKRLPGGVIIYYLLWQIGAYRYMKRRLKSGERFDVVHHVTFVSARFPSLMGRLGIPFVLGPVAGGEYSPAALWRDLGWRARWQETARYLSGRWIRLSPLMRATFRSASHILVSSRQTAMLVPVRERNRVSVMLGIALAGAAPDSSGRATEAGDATAELKLLYAGRFLYWKGMELGLYAFARYLAIGRKGSVTLYGAGPEDARWKSLAERLGIADRVAWFPAMEQWQLMQAMKRYDALLFPSLHDSGGMVVLEAMSKGLPVICLDAGGPAVMVSHGETGFKSPIDNREAAINGLYQAMIALSDDPELRRRMGDATVARVRENFFWEDKVDRIGTIYQSVTEPHDSGAK